MDIIRLKDPRVDPSYLPDEDPIISGYTSAVWAERDLLPGDFEIKTYNIAGGLSDLPEGSFISHLETQEVMKVETHSISMVGEGNDAVPQLTIKGRSPQTIFDDRNVITQYQQKRKMRRKYTPASAAAVLMWNAVNNSSGRDVTRGDNNPKTKLEKNDYPYNTSDILPNVAITLSVANEGSVRNIWLESGTLGPQLSKILEDAGLGIRVMRPLPMNPGTVVNVRTALAERGEIATSTFQRITQLRFEVFKGVDRSNAVVFDARTGDLEKMEYLWSSQDHKTYIDPLSGLISFGSVYRTGDYAKTGWDRKGMTIDVGNPELPDEPEKPDPLRKNATKAQKNKYDDDLDKWIDDHAEWRREKQDVLNDFRDSVSAAVQRELKARRMVNMFSADATLDSQYRYKSDYNLGDTVKLIGDYGRSSKMIVAEYVRTQDENGDRGFPGFVEL